MQPLEFKLIRIVQKLISSPLDHFNAHNVKKLMVQWIYYNFLSFKFGNLKKLLKHIDF